MGQQRGLSLHEIWMRDRVVVQAGNVPELDREVRCGLPVRSVEGPVFSGMPVDIHGHMKGLLNVLYRRRNIDVHAITRSAHHRKAVCFGKMNYGVIILLAWAKPRSELFHREELVVRRARRIVELFQKLI